MAFVSILFGALVTLAGAYGLGAIALRKFAAPPEIVLAVGAVLESFLIFLILVCGVGHWGLYLAIAAGSAAAIRVRKPLDPIRIAPAAAIIFGAYGIFYLVNALAPEILADGITYHLGLPYEYTRAGGFPGRIAFYEILPQGMEMLYTMAFAFGKHSAAKLIEFAIFAAGIPLILRIGRRLRISETGSLLPAVFYFTAPVIAVTGTTSYNDTALVFFTLAAFYLLLVWSDTADDRYLLPAGLLAGFCYAIKMPGIFTAAGAFLFVLARQPKRTGRAAFAIAAPVLPWVLRSLILTGNPVAPLMNGVFSNPWFHAPTEADLASGWKSLHAIPPAQVPWELAFGDHLMGTFGPLLFALPLALAGLRKRACRLCLAAGVLLAIPWYSNTGARFLAPAVTFAIIAVGAALPRPAVWAAIAIQAVICWPNLLDTWLPPYQFRLHEFPWRAALRIESEPHYLATHIAQFNVAKMVEDLTPADARIFSVMPVANAYLARDVSETWHSAEGDRMIEALRMAAIGREDWYFNWTASWPAQPLRALRFRMPRTLEWPWDIGEVQLYSNDVRLYNSPQWTLRAWPNRWETPLALDGKRVTLWRTWQPVRAGMYFEIDMDHPQLLSSVVLLSHTPVHTVPLEFLGQGTDGKWRRLTTYSDAVRRPPEDLRLEATGVLKRAGFRYLLVPTQFDSYAAFGRMLVDQAPQWGLEQVGEAGANVLFRIR